MIKYSFEQKKALVTAYLNGEGGIRTVIKKYGYSNRSQLQRWIVAYQMYGDDGLKISQKTFNYSFEKKLTVVKLYLSSKLSYQEVSLQTGIKPMGTGKMVFLLSGVRTIFGPNVERC